MARDKYGLDSDPDCYPQSDVLVNHFNIRDDLELSLIEIEITTQAAESIEFCRPPYDFSYLKTIHFHLFKDLYPWAGVVRSVDISKGSTRFCTASRIMPEGQRLFGDLEALQWFSGAGRSQLIASAAEFYGELNMLHPFREGNGRALRLLFEHIIINAGFEVDWTPVDRKAWLDANIAAVDCDYGKLEEVFDRCVGR